MKTIHDLDGICRCDRPPSDKCDECKIIESNKITLLWLDDMRDPFTGEWIAKYAPKFLLTVTTRIVWVKTYDEFRAWIVANGLPHMVAFDHDLGEDVAKAKVIKGMSKRQARKEKRLTFSGMDACEWLVDYCIDKAIEFPRWVVQSANPVGAKAISSLIINFIKHSEKHRNAPPL